MPTERQTDVSTEALRSFQLRKHPSVLNPSYKNNGSSEAYGI